MRRFAVILMTALAVTGSVAACGSSGGGSTPQATLKTFLNALASGDGSTACAQLTSGQQKEITTAASSSGLKNATCDSVVKALSKELSSADKKKLSAAQFNKVTVTGNTATATFKAGSGTARLTKTNGKWLISGGLSEG